VFFTVIPQAYTKQPSIDAIPGMAYFNIGNLEELLFHWKLRCEMHWKLRCEIQGFDSPGTFEKSFFP
jgi:hypothetical protein